MTRNDIKDIQELSRIFKNTIRELVFKNNFEEIDLLTGYLEQVKNSVIELKLAVDSFKIEKEFRQMPNKYKGVF
jgi:hypothetical protein